MKTVPTRMKATDRRNGPEFREGRAISWYLR